MLGNHKSLRRPGAELLIASFVVLFQELALIRWIPTQVRVLAYFPNVVLLSAFLGLGVGALRAGKRSLQWLWVPSLLLLAMSAYAASRVAFTQRSATDHLWLLYYDLPRDAPLVQDVRLPIFLAFALTSLAFIPLGQIVGERLKEFREANASLWGYSSDLLGSLLGVVGFALASFTRTGPVVWFAVVLLLGLLLIRGSAAKSLSVAGTAALILLIFWADRADTYSPYYALQRVPLPAEQGFVILTNGSEHQYAAPLRVKGALQPQNASLREGYHLPYQLLGRAPGRVLVLGGGSGNDASVALANNASRVDVVEIDPVILEWGAMHHPDLPYSSPRVHTFVTDARAFLNESTEQYDLIVFGTLDSMTRLSALSNVRLDNFVYTEESIRAAAARLSPGGGVVMYFPVAADYIDERLAAMLTKGFGEPPVGIHGNFGSFNRIFLAGPAFSRIPRSTGTLAGAEHVPSDNWPFLYLRGRAPSSFYLSLIAAFLLFSVLVVYLAAPEMRRRPAGAGGFDAQMFLFGMAFLLLETKAVTEMNLVWGATWLTSAVVFASILLMLLLSTILMQLQPLSWPLASSGLVVSLLLNYFTPVQWLAREDLLTRSAASALFVGLPLFFAASCFAIMFRDRNEAQSAFGWNLLGAVVGGLVEFASMVSGFKALTLLALALYLIAFVSASAAKRNRSEKTTYAPEGRVP